MRSLALGMVLVAAAAAPASAQRVDPRLTAVIDCVKVADPAQRLACFDKALQPLSQAAAAGALESRSLGPKSLEAKIRAMRGQGPDRLLVQLDNDDRWVFMLEGNERIPKAGDTVTAKRGVLGNWWVTVKKGQTFQAKFLGPPEGR